MKDNIQYRYKVTAHYRPTLAKPFNTMNENCITLEEAMGWVVELKQEKDVTKIELYDNAKDKIINTYNLELQGINKITSTK
jgi:hypothetical protein